MKRLYDLKDMVCEKNGYEYIASKELYIPVEEIGLNILIRKQQQLLFFYEIILKLIDSGITHTEQISDITGVEEEILNDVIADMSVEELIYLIGNNLRLTVNGKKALSQLMQEVIEKDSLRKIFIDCITGEVYESINTVSKPKHNNPWLESEQKINDDFIIKRFNQFNSVYKERQEEYSIDTLGIVKQKEIYQILNKEYGRTYYLEKNIKIYKNLSDNSFIFEIGSEIDEAYILSFRRQLESKFGAKQILVSERDFPKNTNINFIEDKEKTDNTNKLTEAINNINKDDIEKYYETDRYLYSGEFEKILLNLKRISPSKLVITSRELKNILNNDVIQILNSILDRTEITIVADKEEWKIDDLKKRILNKDSNKKNKIEWRYGNKLIQDTIVIYPYCVIEKCQIPIKYDERNYILKELSTISYKRENIDYMLELIL